MTESASGRSRPAGQTTGSAERPAQQVSGPLLTFDLNQEAERLRHEDAWLKGDHNAKTLVKGAEERVVLVVLKAGAHLAPHHAPSAFTVQVLAGQIEFSAAGQVVQLHPGSLLALESGLTHAVTANAESTFLLTLGAVTE